MLCFSLLTEPKTVCFVLMSSNISLKHWQQNDFVGAINGIWCKKLAELYMFDNLVLRLMVEPCLGRGKELSKLQRAPL